MLLNIMAIVSAVVLMLDAVLLLNLLILLNMYRLNAYTPSLYHTVSDVGCGVCFIWVGTWTDHHLIRQVVAASLLSGW